MPEPALRKLVRLLTSSGNCVLNVANLARSEPKDFKFAKPPGFQTLYLTYKVNSSPVLCYLFGVSSRDFTKNPLMYQSGKYSKTFSLVPQALEIDRKVALICEVAGVQQYAASLYGNVLTFQTRSGELDGSRESSEPHTIRLFLNFLSRFLSCFWTLSQNAEVRGETTFE